MRSGLALDHFAFAVSDVAELEGWVAHLNDLDVEHSGVIGAHFGPTVVLRDPDNIQLELFVFNPAGEDVNTLVSGDPHGRTDPSQVTHSCRGGAGGNGEQSM